MVVTDREQRQRRLDLEKCVTLADSKAALARALGVPKSTLWRWLNGERPVPGPTAAAVRTWLAQGVIS